MRVVRNGQNLELIMKLRGVARVLASERGRVEMHRGVVDAGRKTKTRVQRAVRDQMGLKPGNYQSYVIAGTRGVGRRSELSFEIFGVKGGARAENYKGLMSVKSGGLASSRMNAGRAETDRGTVRSAVWNRPRVFKRSFATGQGFFAMRPARAGSQSTAPKAFWTFGRKPNQQRGTDGKFVASGKLYGKVRRLFGPSLMKEIPQDDSLEAFLQHGPPFLEQAVTKRMEKLMRF